MADVLLLHLNDISEALVATSLIKRLVKDGCNVHTISDENSSNVFRYCTASSSIMYDKPITRVYDVAINLSPSYFSSEVMRNVSANKKLGYSVSSDGNIEFLNDGAKRHYESRHLGIVSKSNAFQLLFSLSDLVWQGEGYSMGYFPRNRTNKKLTGVATKDTKLKHFLLNDLNLESSRLWEIPFKKNILKQMDETNRCKQIVTDDLTILHVALALRKNVEFLVQKEPNYRIEMFGSGKIHIYDGGGIKTEIISPQKETNVTS